MNTDKHNLDQVTEKVIGCAFAVSNTLGVGLLEKVYENALTLELRQANLEVAQQESNDVLYRGAVVGSYVADLVVNNEVLVELKAVKALDNIHMAHCLNYLKATGMKVCLLLNFGTPKLQIKRIMN